MEADKTFLKIRMRLEYKEYEELTLNIHGIPYLVKIPKGNVKGYSQTLGRIHYKLEHTSPPQQGCHGTEVYLVQDMVWYIRGIPYTIS